MTWIRLSGPDGIAKARAVLHLLAVHEHDDLEKSLRFLGERLR